MATAVCEKHKLRFDPERQDGCVICRREAAPLAPPAAEPAGADGIGAPLAVASAIWLVSALVLFATQRELARAYVLEQEQPQLDVAFDPEAQPSLGPQTDVVLQELEALQQEQAERTGTDGAPLGMPSADELSQDADRLREVEGVDSAPVEIELDGEDEDGL